MQPATTALSHETQPALLTARLSELGIDPEVLRNAAGYGMQHAFQCTLHDPPGLAGIIMWGKTVRSLRDQLILRGWEPSNARNYATVIHPTGRFAIGVAAGDAHTGLIDRLPSTRSEKGPATQDAVAQNQLSFSDYVDSFPRTAVVARRQTWLLLHYWDEEAGEIRLELSLPMGMSGDGFVGSWRERLILPPLSFGAGPAPDDETEDDEIEVEIQRRTS